MMKRNLAVMILLTTLVACGKNESTPASDSQASSKPAAPDAAAPANPEIGIELQNGLCEATGFKTSIEGMDERGSNAAVSTPDQIKTFWGSGAKGDEATGKIVIDTVPAGHWFIPVVTGPVGAGQSILVTDDAGRELAKIQGTAIPNWRSLEVNAEKPLKISVSDQGKEWGQWVAIGAPQKACNP